MPRPIQAAISASALRHNYGVAKAAAMGSRVIGVVKANAYGHGALDEPAREAYASLVDSLYDEEFDEALFELRSRLRARHDEQMALGEHGHEHTFEEAVLPDDDLLDLVEDALHQRRGGLGFVFHGGPWSVWR